MDFIEYGERLADAEQTAPTPADVPGQGEVDWREAWRALDNALIYLWSTTGSRRGNNGRQGQLDYGMRNAHTAVERILAARLAERDAEVARAAKVEALREAAREMPGFAGIRTHGDVAKWLRIRADRIERTR